MEKKNTKVTSASTEVGNFSLLSTEEVFALIDKACNMPDARQPGEKTIQEMSQHWGCSDAAAANRLNRAYKAGTMTKRAGRVDGKNAMLYKPVTQ